MCGLSSDKPVKDIFIGYMDVIIDDGHVDCPLVNVVLRFDEPSCHLQMRARSISIKPITHKSLPVGNIHLYVRDADIGNRMLFMICDKDDSVPVVPHPHVYDLMR